MTKNLKRVREQRGLSLAALAGLAGIGKSTLGNYEQGKTVMSPEKVAAVADCLKTTPDEIARNLDDSVYAPAMHGRHAQPCPNCLMLHKRLSELEDKLTTAYDTINNQSKALAQGRAPISKPPHIPAASSASAGGKKQSA